MRFVLATSLILGSLPSVLSWGAAGHEIVATIAQIHLHPNVRSKLCSILPAEAKCHLAPVAAWADQVKYHYPGSAPMHYVNPKLDHPADHCEFGEHGWLNEDVNVLTGIMNETARIMAGEGDIPLRFLVHFVGDMHQPLHLTGRDKGGNGAMFLFEGRHRNLHSVWDSGIITKKIRELSNYTSPLPSKQIESALPGAIFDPYVRWIVWEGIRQWWKDDLATWLTCPVTGDPYPHSSVDPSIAPSSPPFLEHLRGASSLLLQVFPKKLQAAMTLWYPIPLKETENYAAQLLAQHPVNRALGSLRAKAAPVDTADGAQEAQGASQASEQPTNSQTEADVQTTPNTTAIPACPFTWSKPIHELNCDLIWPKQYTGDHSVPLIELDTPEYLGRIDDAKVVEKLLAMGGIRLASILNTVYGSPEEQGLYFPY